MKILAIVMTAYIAYYLIRLILSEDV